MSITPVVPQEVLVPVENWHPEPRTIAILSEPRKASNLTLVEGKTFLSVTNSGDVAPPGAPDVGLFFDDTRFLSQYELHINNTGSVVLSSNTERSYSATVELTTGHMQMLNSFDLPENTLHIRREQLLGNDAFFDSIMIENFNLREVELEVEITFDCDFVDVFQVRGCARADSGQYYRPLIADNTITFVYDGLDKVRRSTQIEMRPAPCSMENRTACWRLTLLPSQKTELLLRVTPHVAELAARNQAASYNEILEVRRQSFADWEAQSTKFGSSDHVFMHALQNAIGDFHALQIPDGDEHIIAAGIPWFATIFGRDSVIAAFQSLLLNPQLAQDTLRVLARYQGKVHDDWRDEEPGKILHELRTGEMTRDGEMPFGPYYGSVDATPLFLILLSETFNWTADERLVRDLLPNAYAALDWIEKHGDLDGDGLVEYQRRSPRGLTNQGWKDSWDANMHADGSVAEPPIAPIEVQGYVYDAKYRMASLLRHFGDSQTADQLRREASEMAKRIDKAFWMPAKGFYAMALDGKKNPLRVISSNPGHLLFTRALNTDRARSVVKWFMRPELNSGWGLRTMSQAEPVFNPLSYHRGSVWPHDNSLVAHGMALYDYREEVITILTALFQAALNFRDYRLPELFCGVQRRGYDEPVHYPVSCSPQAWASGTFLLLLTSILGIRPAAPRRELNIVNPRLPDWLDHLTLRDLKVGNSRVALDFSRHGARTYCNVISVDGEKLVVNVITK
jgi:glycogen debranching enzyme